MYNVYHFTTPEQATNTHLLVKVFQPYDVPGALDMYVWHDIETPSRGTIASKRNYSKIETDNVTLAREDAIRDILETEGYRVLNVEPLIMRDIPNKGNYITDTWFSVSLYS